MYVFFRADMNFAFTILALALPSITTQDPIPLKDEIVMDEFSKVYREAESQAYEGVHLVMNVLAQVKNYECVREEADCDAWETESLAQEFFLSNANCNETPEKEICRRAIDKLGLEENSSHQEIENEFSDHVNGINAADFKYINVIRDATTSYVCFKEPEKCPLLR